jgi:hypothetical protein
METKTNLQTNKHLNTWTKTAEIHMDLQFQTHKNCRHINRPQITNTQKWQTYRHNFKLQALRH